MEFSTVVILAAGSPYRKYEKRKDTHKARMVRYRLVLILVMKMLANLYGEYTPSGIADWVQRCLEHFFEMLIDIITYRSLLSRALNCFQFFETHRKRNFSLV